MKPASRTPEGEWNRCPVCGHGNVIDPSVSMRDAPCPCCGHLLWFRKSVMDKSPTRVATFAELEVDGEPASVDCSGVRSEIPVGRTLWTGLTVLSSLAIGEADQSLLSAGVWLLSCAAFGQIAWPFLIRRAQESPAVKSSFAAGVACGWALVPGPPVGIVFGVILPWVYEWPISALVGAFVGLVVGPIVAAAEGLVVGGFVWLVFRMVTGRSLV